MKHLTVLLIISMLMGCSYMTKLQVGSYTASHSVHASNAGFK